MKPGAPPNDPFKVWPRQRWAYAPFWFLLALDAFVMIVVAIWGVHW